MVTVLGIIMIILGLILVILGVLVFFKIIKVPDGQRMLKDTGFFDLLKELLMRAPWLVVVGLLLIWMGMKLVGVEVGL
jgi:hypothetical protein